MFWVGGPTFILPPKEMSFRTLFPQSVLRSVVSGPEYAAPFLLGPTSAIHRSCQSGVIQKKGTSCGYIRGEVYCRKSAYDTVGTGKVSQKPVGPVVRKGSQNSLAGAKAAVSRWDFFILREASALLVRPFNRLIRPARII